MVVLLAALLMSLGLINLDFGRRWWRGQWRRLAVGVPLVLIFAYVQMPPLVMPQALTLVLLTLVPNAAYSLLLSARNVVISRRIVSIRRTPFWPYLVVTAAFAALALVLAIAPVVDASGLRDVAGPTLSNGTPPAADLARVRVVPEESAIFAGNKVIGQLGAYYRVGTYNVQSENGHLVWVAPLDFQGVIQWISRRTSPGVIVVSAENPDAAAELRQRAPMRYVPSALFNDNLYRHIYLTYGTEQILETTLQLDETGNPRYIATLGRPTIGWTGQVVTAVVIVDPQSGAMQRIPRSSFEALPRWVSRVVPPDLALAYNDWFGRYVHGWWNAQLARRDVHLPARDEVFGLLLSGGRFVWFVDHTSPAATDNSMTGFTYMDSRTGALTYYTASGGEFNSAGAESAVAGNPIVRQGRLIPTQPVLYHVFGRNTWVVPAVADNGKFQTLALVEAANGHVTIGNPSAPSPTQDAFAAYRSFTGTGTGSTATASRGSLSGTIDRIANAGDAIVFTIADDRRIFTLRQRPSLAPESLLARAGDRVEFAVKPGPNGQNLVTAFRDQSLAP